MDRCELARFADRGYDEACEIFDRLCAEYRDRFDRAVVARALDTAHPDFQRGDPEWTAVEGTDWWLRSLHCNAPVAVGGGGSAGRSFVDVVMVFRQPPLPQIK